MEAAVNCGPIPMIQTLVCIVLRPPDATITAVQTKAAKLADWRGKYYRPTMNSDNRPKHNVSRKQIILQRSRKVLYHE